MKMKRVTLGFSILAAASAFILSCTKEPNVAPVPDTETQSSVYASYANFIASDIDQVCSFLGGDQLLSHFYIDYPGTATGITGSLTVTRDTNVVINGIKIKQVSISWNKTKCLDGVDRDGTIIMRYNKKNVANADYIHRAGFEAEIYFSNYKVNGWLIELSDPANPMRLNIATASTVVPTGPNLAWTIIGKLKMQHPTDINKNMIWETQGLTKTLENTNEAKVYDPKKQAGAITWSLGVVNYVGKVFGNCPRIDSTGKVTEILAPYTMTVNPNFALTRDFKCFPVTVSGVAFTQTVGVLAVRTLEFHPYNKGITTFTVSNAYPREIYYGGEGNSLPYQCDNTGEVLLKGNSYRVNFLQ